MQSNPHRACCLTEDLGNVGGLQAGDDPQRDGLGLVLGQPGEQRHGALYRDAVQHLVLDHLVVREDVQADGHRAGRPPGPGSGRVDGAVPGR